MRRTEAPDPELLSSWLGEGDEAAFRQLVERYAGLVHAAAVRITGDPSLSAEAAQSTFILLSRKAKALCGRPSLAGWLHVTAAMQARNLLRRQRREQGKRERMRTMTEGNSDNSGQRIWGEMKPVLDDALDGLPEKDREALLLHFYRSLSFREVGDTLGIASEAARKRIERATAKLRAKLASRGVHAGEALPSILLAGFTGDAQMASAQISALITKISSAGSASTASIPSSLLIMKATPFLPPVAALVVAGIWIVPKRQVIASHPMSQATQFGLAMGFPRQNVGASGGKEVARTGTEVKAGIDWVSVAARSMEDASSGRTRNVMRVDELLLIHQLDAMSGEELLGELERIDASDVAEGEKASLRSMLYLAIVRRDPLFALTHLEDRLGKVRGIEFDLAVALNSLIKDDPAAAAAWLDRQVAEGRLESKRLDGKSQSRSWLEGGLVQGYMKTDMAAAAARLEAISPKDRIDVLWSMLNLREDDFVPHATLVRDHLSAKEAISVIANRSWMEVTNGGYAKVDAYLEKIDASPEERLAAGKQAVIGRVSNLALNRKVTLQDMEAAWKWLSDSKAENATRTLGDALAAAAGFSAKTDFSEAGELAVQITSVAGDDGALEALLRSKSAIENKDEARQLAMQLPDEERREEILKLLR